MTKKNCLSLLGRPEPGENREMKPETWTVIAMGASTNLTLAFLRFEAAVSGSTKRSPATGTSCSTAFDPHRAVIDDFREGEPSVWIWSDFLLADSHKEHPKALGQLAYPVSDTCISVSLTPPFSCEQGTSAYALMSVNTLPNSRFACRSNSFRRTGSGVKRPRSMTVVPRW